MAAPGAELVAPVIVLIAIVLTGLSGYYVYLQKTTLYREVKNLLVYVHILFEGVLVVEFLRNFLSSSFFMFVYTDFGTSFIIWDVLLLTAVATIVYLRPKQTGIRGLIKETFEKKFTAMPLTAFFFFTIVADAYLFAFNPYTIVKVKNLAGITLPSSAFDTSYLLVVFAILVLFAVFSLSLFLLARSRSKDHQVRRALLILPIVWVSIGVDLVYFNGFLLSQGIDAVAVGYMLAALAFGITATIFRRASLLSGFFETVAVTQTISPTHPFSKKLNIPETSLLGRIFLFEVDPSFNYEQGVKEFAIEMMSANAAVFAFTWKGSPIYNTLSNMGIRFYILSTTVSYPRPTESNFEILVPQNDHAILLDLMQKTIESNAGGHIAIIYDNISDLILSTNIESSYKFIKQANEIMASAKLSALFLFTYGAHDEKAQNLIRSLFSNHLSQSPIGLKLTRGREL
ncbi:MAG: hypothetical protein JRN52_01675 [Nitrososphaerota archaeon]|nr:hypothetical protein [Nitrososphaerota archaeon]